MSGPHRFPHDYTSHRTRGQLVIDAAVRGVAAILAKDALIQFLKLQKDIADPGVRLGEEIAEDAAAMAVSAWRTPAVFGSLLDCALPQPRVGLIEALGAFANVEAVPYFIRALEDDTCRSAAEQAIRNLGTGAGVALLATDLTRVLDGDESPASVKRRISALEILGELGPSPAFWALLHALIDDSNADIVIAPPILPPR